MSDYYGSATLEDWLAEEVFNVDKVPVNVVLKFEKWREGIEGQIDAWMLSDDGDGNNLSWREWGRGFYGIPDDEEEEFEAAVNSGNKILEGE